MRALFFIEIVWKIRETFDASLEAPVLHRLLGSVVCATLAVGLIYTATLAPIFLAFFLLGLGTYSFFGAFWLLYIALFRNCI